MAKQNINVGTTANDKKGDSLRAAFVKVNANFTELYTALGLADTTLNLGAFTFTGSTMSTDDSTPIVIDQATTITSDLTVSGDIVPGVANGGNLGSLAKPFRSLYVSNSTVFLGGVPLSLEPGTNELRVNNIPISQNITYADIPNAPTDVSDLTDTGNLLGGGDGGGLSITDFGLGFTDSLDAGKITTSKLYNENPNQGLNNLYVLEVTNGGVVALPDGSIINGATLKTVAGNYAGITAGPASPAGKDEDSWVWVDNDGATIATKYSTDAHTWSFRNDGKLTLPNGSTIGDGEAGSGVPITTARGTILLGNLAECAGGESHFHIMKGGQQAIDLFLGDDSNYVKLPSTGGVEIATQNFNQYSWIFSTDGNLTIPGDIRSEGNINIDINLSDSTLHRWQFGEDGVLTFPNGGRISNYPDGVGVNNDSWFVTPGNGSGGVSSQDGQQYIQINDDLHVEIGTSYGTENESIWQFGLDGNLTLPAGGDIVNSDGESVLGGGGGNANTGDFTFSEDTITNGDGLILSTNRGTLAIGTNMEGIGVAQHFHIAFDGSNNNPPASDLFLGDDYNYVKLPGYELNPTAQFGVEVGTDNRGAGPQNVEVDAVDELVPPGGVWRLFIIVEDYPNLGSAISVGDTVTTSWGTPITATITDVVEDSGDWQIHVAQDITAGFDSGDTVSFGSSGDSYIWRFGTDGDLAIPPGKTIRDAMTGNDLLDIKVVRQDTAPTADNGTLWFNTLEGRLYIKYSDVWVDAAPLVQPPPDTDLDVNSITFPDASVLTSVADLTPDRLVSGVHELVLGTDGNLTLPAGGDILDSTGTSVLGVGGTGDSLTSNDDITITVDSGDSSSYTWNFGQTGTLTAPGMAVFGGTDGIVVDNLNEGIAALFNNGDVYITGGESLRFTGLDNIEGESSSVLRFWNGEGRHSSGNDATELVTLDVGNDADSGDPTLGFFKIITEKQVGGEKEWKFDADGDLTLPPGGDILDSEGNSVLGGGAGNSNVWVQTFETQSGAPTDIVAIAISVEYDSAGNVIALFSHFNDDNSSSYYSVGKYTTTGAKIWTARFDDEFNTDGWGLAVDNDSDSIYVAGETDVEEQDNATLTKIDAADGSIIWSKIYDFGYTSRSSVVDVASDGNPVMVGYASNGTDDYVATTKVDAADGSVIWSRALDGQADEEAYGMAVGPTGEVVAIGFMDQLTTVLESYPVTPQTGSGMEVLVINRSDLSNDTFTDSWKVAGTGIAEYADVTFINSYSGLTGTVQQGSGATFDVVINATGIYSEVNIVNGGNNYLVGHKILIPGTSLEGISPTNDIVITVTSVSGTTIDGIDFIAGSYGNAQAAPYTYSAVSGTNYQTGSGLVFSLQLDSGNTYTIHPFTFQNAGANYVDGDVVVISGTQLGGTSPANDLTATVSVTDGGAVATFSLFSGTQQTSTYRIIVAESNVDFSGTGTWTLNDVTVDQDNRMLIVKYNSAGAIQWQKAVQFDADEGCRGADADIDADGNIYVCGNHDTVIGVAMNLVKFNSSGVKQWSRRIVGDCVDFATSVVVGPDNNLYLSGVTSTPDTNDVTWVVAKYNTTGSVIWQRLIENTASWTFTGSLFFQNAGGSNIAVSPDYVLLGGGFGTIENDEDPTATVVQIDTNGTLFSIGNWALTAASFTGNLDDSASDITVVNTGKADTDNAENITTSTVTLTTEVSGFLIGTLYNAPDGNDSLVNGEYSVSLGNTGTLTLPAGGTISEGVVTSNPTIQLTPASPDVASQKLVIKGGGPGISTTENGITINVSSNTWTEGNVDYVNVDAPTRGGQTLYWWIYPEDAGLSTPSTGTVVLDEFGEGNFSLTLDSDAYEFRIRVSPEEDNYDPANVGVQSVLINSGSPTFEGEHHLHLTTGDLSETSIFLGTDDHNVRTTTDGKIQITTSSETNRVWEFDTTGNLTIPGNIRSEGNIDIEINLSDSTLRRWSFGEDGGLAFPDATVQTTAWTGIPGPYADDEAAALAGVALGSPYHKTGTGGQVFVRLTSPT